METHDTTTMTAPAPNWQRWSLFFARTGYSELELSTFMTAQGFRRARTEADRAAADAWVAAALAADAERTREAASVVSLPLTLAAAAD